VPVPPPLLSVVVASIPVVGVLWLLDLPLRLGVAVLDVEYLSAVAGLGSAAGLLLRPYPRWPWPATLMLALAAFLSWFWGAWNHESWLLDIANRGPEKWLPGAVAIVLLLEAMRKTCGIAITVLVWTFLLYGLFGEHLPGVLQAAPSTPQRVTLYLYSDGNGVPGLVIHVGATIVLAFIIMGKIMEKSGASGFFTDVAMATMGHRRGGPAKVAIVASSIFGTVNGTTVGNIMSTGIITIPLMKKNGYPARFAAAVEAVASNGGQIMPPVMGTTAFLIAEFLQVAYVDVVKAALLPALLYYLVLFASVDRFAARRGLSGLPRSELPALSAALARGWLFLGPIALLLYLLFGLGYNPGKSALYSAGLMFLLGALRDLDMLRPRSLIELAVESGRTLVPLLLICAGAGVVIGVVQLTGIGFSLVLVLAKIGEAAGLLAMLLVTAVVAIILGMGMPTAAVYVVLSVILAPALTNMGLAPMAAHLFIFYFGLISMLTPPVAVASYVAANLAEASMWQTSTTAIRLAAGGYLLPFLFVYDPALLLYGSWLEIGVALIAAATGGLLLAAALENGANGLFGLAWRGGLAVAAAVTGLAPHWLGSGPVGLVPALIVVCIFAALRGRYALSWRTTP
jgi:TRAP transporter 4TM/12TM fusion protein